MTQDDIDALRDRVQAAAKDQVDAVRLLFEEIKRLDKENEKLRATQSTNDQMVKVMEVAIDWYNDPNTESTWNRPCGADYDLRRAVREVLESTEKRRKKRA